jgi:RNA polymerase sigma-70 factor (ECF subfamily)
MADKLVAAAVRPMDVDDIYRAHVRALYAFIYRRVGNREAAEDLTSDVFVKALTYLDPTREEHSIVAWLYRVARNAVTDYWRQGQGGSVVVLEEARIPGTPPPARDTVYQHHTPARAQALLDRLPENYRTVLAYRLFEGASVTETARRIGTSEGNVKVLQHRALKYARQLREDDSADDEGDKEEQSP